MGGFWGSHLGVIDLMLERDGSDWRVLSHSVENPPHLEAERRPLDHGARGERSGGARLGGRAVHEETLAYVRRAVGKTAAPLAQLLRPGRR